MEPENQKKQFFNPYFGVVVGIFAVSTASIFIKYAQQNEVASIVIAAYRLGLAVLLIAPIILARYRNDIAALSLKELGLSLLSGIFLAFHFATWIKSLEFTSVASSVVLVTTTPLWVAIVSPFTLKENVSKTILTGMVVALTGTLVIGFSDICSLDGRLICPPYKQFFQGPAIWGDFLALSGAWTAAGYVLIGRKIRPRLSLFPYIFLVYGMAAIILIVLLLLSREQAFGFSTSTYVWLVLLALIPQLLGHSTFNWALGYLPAAFVAVTLLGEPVGSTVLAYIFLGEEPGIIKIIGAILIFIGIIIAFKPEKQRKDLEKNLG